MDTSLGLAIVMDYRDCGGVGKEEAPPIFG
jgi:hypothetical protein